MKFTIGFYESDKGVILADKKPLQEFDIYSFRHHIGYVPQDTIILNDTVNNNLLWSNEKATEEEIIEGWILLSIKKGLSIPKLGEFEVKEIQKTIV